MNSINQNNLKLGIIGYPLAHTLSPKIHEYWLKLHGISGAYEILEVVELELSSEEKENFQKSVGVVRELFNAARKIDKELS